MEPSEITTFFDENVQAVIETVSSTQTYIQLLVIALIYAFSFFAAFKFVKISV